MSAIKNHNLRILFSMLLLLTFFSCKKKEEPEKKLPKNPNEITSISLSNIGGSLGNYIIIKVTKDSIHLEKGITANKTHKQRDLAISPSTWKQLVSSINTKDLDYIKSSPSVQSVDGIDETFQIRTPKKSHVYVNAYQDTVHYKQLQKFKDQLQKILPKDY